jgi:hypothetical protein
MNTGRDTWNCTTRRWVELKARLLTLLPDIKVELAKLEKEYERLLQARPATKYLDAYKGIVASMALNHMACTLHTPESSIILTVIVTKLKPQVPVLLAGHKFRTVGEAYSAAND